MIILGVFIGHDACAALFDDYRMVAAIAQERLTRIKGDGGRFPDEAVDECLAVAGLSRSDVDVLALPRYGYDAGYIRNARSRVRKSGRARRKPRAILLKEMIRQGVSDGNEIFDSATYVADHGFAPGTRTFFYDHHMAHALTALFHTDWEEGTAYTHDGGGDRLMYSAYRLAEGRIEPVFGSVDTSLARIRWQSSSASVARLYGEVTEALGFKKLRHEGKVLGLAAFGKPRFASLLGRGFVGDRSGRLYGLHSLKSLKNKVLELAATEPREDIAASIQQVAEQVTLRLAGRVLRRTGHTRLGVAGGLFANVRVNQLLAEEFGLDELFVYPAMSDQGEAAGGALQFLLERDGPGRWLKERTRLDTLYYGRDYGGGIDKALRGAGAVADPSRDIPRATAERIRDGAAVATYLQQMEYGPRALGARSIMAAAVDRSINDSLNKRLDRTEFMPFAPVARVERAGEVFDLPSSLAYSANFMTTTCGVRPEWRERIPAVVHVDNTARPQLIGRSQNPVYYDVLQRYEELTGLPAFINTSFNAHEEPIINTPDEAVAALVAGRVDAIVTEGGLWSMPGE